MRSASWHTSPLAYGPMRALAAQLGVSETLAAILIRRGYGDPQAAHRFLMPQGELNDPFLFPQMEAVCRRIRQAIAAGETICIHGDYDVDGITATAVMTSGLSQLGAKVVNHLPNRFREGYGIALATVEKIAAEGATLLITVDCGVGAKKQLERAADLGLEAIVIDHHRPLAENLPPATIICPLLCDYPFKGLAGVGLAFKVLQALVGEAGATTAAELHPLLEQQLDLVALGTIADVVPLVGENRSLVKRGLNQMARGRRPGLKALMQVGQVEPTRLNAGLVAFRLAPRINAAGRLEDPRVALELLLAESETEAQELAGQLDGLNRERQRIENQMVAEAQDQIARLPEALKEARGYVLSSPKWHEGVIGILASRLVELHYRPVIAIAEGEEFGKGSGRSIPSFNLHQSLQDLSRFFTAYGGHRVACGLTIPVEDIAAFGQEFGAYADGQLAGEELAPSRYIDALVCGRELTLGLAEELAQLEPFGLGNPSVDLLATGAQIQGGRATKNGRHLQCRIEAGGAQAKAIGFDQAFLLDKLAGASKWDVAFRLERNEFNGSVAPQLSLRSLFPRPEETEPAPGLCPTRCDYDCPERLGGAELWSLVQTGAPLPAAWTSQAGPVENLSERLVDRRGYGSIPGQIAKLITSGESVMVLVADVARRRYQLLAELNLNGPGPAWTLLASSRCSAAALAAQAEELAGQENLLALADFATATALPDLTERFDHLVFVDPPLQNKVFRSLAGAAPQAYLHLFHCANEVQFTGKVLEHEYDLRAPLTKLYQHLRTAPSRPLDQSLERLLLAGGKHLRGPQLIARCLRVLEELKLISIDWSAPQPMLTLLESGKTKLELSPTYNQLQDFYRECLPYLSKSLNGRVT